MERAWLQLEMTVQIVTKLNRGSIIHGRAAYLLPCLGRIEIDRQVSGVQFVTVEDTTGRFHASHGQAEPAGEHILSEPKIVAELAKAIGCTKSRAQRLNNKLRDEGLVALERGHYELTRRGEEALANVAPKRETPF